MPKGASSMEEKQGDDDNNDLFSPQSTLSLIDDFANSGGS